MANITQYDLSERMNKFRMYYNESIFPALLDLEKERKRLVWLMSGSLFFLIVFGYMVVKAHIPALTLFLWIPLFIYASYLGVQIQNFRSAFKPRIVNLILDFIDTGKKREEPNPIYAHMEAAQRGLRYDYERFIPIERFQKSGIFVEPPSYYKGEDYIEGSVGSAKFEMCELDVKKMSYVRPGYDTIFRGIFFYSNFYKIANGSVVIMPKEKRQFLISTIKGITKIGGEQVFFSEPEGFMDEFLVYANCDIDPDKLISQSILESILEYQSLTQKDIYVSIVGSEIYIAVSEPKDILEPRLLQSNANFELVKDFFEDLMLIISIIEDFDLHY
jgi:hypothetical protein